MVTQLAALPTSFKKSFHLNRKQKQIGILRDSKKLNKTEFGGNQTRLTCAVHNIYIHCYMTNGMLRCHPIKWSHKLRISLECQRKKMDQELGHVGRKSQKVFKNLLSIHLSMKLTSLDPVFQNKLKIFLSIKESFHLFSLLQSVPNH